MNKLALIIRREYLAKVRNKSFVIMTFLSPLLMVGMVVLVIYLTKLNDNEKRIIGVFNQSDYFSNDFLSTESTSYVNFKNVSLKQAKDSVMDLGYYGLLHIPDAVDLEKVAQGSFFYTKEAPNTLTLSKLETVFQNRLKKRRLQDLGISTKDFSTLDQPFEIHAGTFKGEQNLKGINEVKLALGGAFGYLIMMFIIIYGGFVMRSVIEEKTSRIIEVIISSVKPIQLMMGKIIGTSLAGITQFAIWVILGSVAMTIISAIFGINLAEMQTPQQELMQQAMQIMQILILILPRCAVPALKDPVNLVKT